MASDRNKQLEFTEKISQVVTNGYLSLALAIGHKSGLFTALASFDEPKSCQEISQASGCKPNYVKEWLGAVVAGGIVDCDPTGDKFFIPPHRRPALTQETPGSCNFACHALGVATMTRSFDNTLKLMKPSDSKDETKEAANLTESHGNEHKDGQQDEKEHSHGHDHGHGHGHGHGHSHEHGHGMAMTKWYNDWSEDFIGSHLISAVVPADHGLPELLGKGGSVLEIGCGIGSACLALGKQYPNASILGTDVSDESVKTAQAEVEKTGLKNVAFQVANANELPSDWTGKFDHAFAMKVMHHTIPSKALREVYRALKPGGTFSMVEIDSRKTLAGNSKLKHGTWLYIMSLMYFVPDEESGSGHHGSHFEHSGGEEGDEITGFLWSKESIERAVARAGFKECSEVKVPCWLFETMYICKK